MANIRFFLLHANSIGQKKERCHTKQGHKSAGYALALAMPLLALPTAWAAPCVRPAAVGVCPMAGGRAPTGRGPLPLLPHRGAGAALSHGVGAVAGSPAAARSATMPSRRLPHTVARDTITAHKRLLTTVKAATQQCCTLFTLLQYARNMGRLTLQCLLAKGITKL